MPSNHYTNIFAGACIDIERLSKAPVEEAYRLPLDRMLFVACITAFETYLSDVFLSRCKPGSPAMSAFAALRRGSEDLAPFLYARQAAPAKWGTPRGHRPPTGRSWDPDNGSELRL
jgi:hypothetical protein